MTFETYAHHFSDRNIPFGIASSEVHKRPQGVTRLGNSVLFLSDCETRGLFRGIDGLPSRIFVNDTLNDFAALPKSVHRAVRQKIQEIVRGSGLDYLQKCVEQLDQVQMHMPVGVGDFTDFSCSLEHVKNAGRIVVNDGSPPPAFFNFPVGYQGRAGSIVVSGTDIERPMGQYRDKTAMPSDNGRPPVVFAPSTTADYELEFAAIIGRPLPMRQRLNAVDADDHVFGFVILNDWSARDIQGFEMTPLGPLNGKSFGTSISPWVVTLDALEAFSVEGVKPTVQIPAYLQDPRNVSYAVRMQAEILSGDAATTVGTSWVQSMYWSPRQMIAHAASAGSPLRTGDIMATGTVTGHEEDSKGCLLEVTEGGVKPFKLNDGSERAFLEDGDVVRMTAVAGGEDSGVGFGECVGKLLPSRPFG